MAADFLNFLPSASRSSFSCSTPNCTYRTDWCSFKTSTSPCSTIEVVLQLKHGLVLVQNEHQPVRQHRGAPPGPTAPRHRFRPPHRFRPRPNTEPHQKLKKGANKRIEATEDRRARIRESRFHPPRFRAPSPRTLWHLAIVHDKSRFPQVLPPRHSPPHRSLFPGCESQF